MPKKIFFIACEPSGDAHAAAMIAELKKKLPDLECRGLGGPKMKAAGTQLLHDMTTISALGLGDVIRQYFTYRRIFYLTLRKIQHWHPDAVCFVDSPAFNLRLAKKLHKKMPTLPLLYYISPQIWAWGKRRIHTIKRIISKMLVILPFEVALYRKANVDCEFVGHPLLDHVTTSQDRDEFRKQLGIPEGQYAIGLLPGSRETEVERILPIMVKSAEYLQKDLPNTLFFIAESSNVKKEIYDQILKDCKVSVCRFESDLYDHMACMDFALVTSGTATLETALLNVPFFLLYKASWSTYFLGKYLIRVPYLGLVNILAGKEIIPEFIQQDAHPETMAHEAKILLKNQRPYEKMKAEMTKVREKLGAKGASQRAAQSVIRYLK